MDKNKLKIKTMYRIVLNKASNDFNNEPELIVIPYEILGEARYYPNEEFDYIVVRKGWGRKKNQQHYLPKNEFYETKEEAELRINLD